MSKLNRIQNEIKQLEGGRFQNLCDVYLYRKRNWENIVSLGSMDGTDKTTKGIPDTYYFDSHSNRYTLVMYGTRKDATAKLETDIREAIEKSKVNEKAIEEIICCHTSSNITVEKDRELRSLADSIKLTLIGIDTLSNDFLQFKYQDIVKDFLGIIESTEQVWNLEQFISVHDKSKTNAPLYTTYIDEAHIVDELVDDINSYQITLLSGVAGTGKTRLAIEIFKKLPMDGNIICVKSNSMPVYQDIKDTLDNSRVNYLLLDDANMITNFDAIVNLLGLEEFEKKLKIVITVRDYALSKIANQINPFNTKIHRLSSMNDDQIKLLIKSISDFSSVSIRKIVKLSHNNPRIAVIAANMVKDESVDFIGNGKEILDNYYGQIIEENSLTSNEKISLFILSFNNKVNLTNREDLKEILDFFKIDFDRFSAALQQLHDKELCDIFQDKAARVSDQSLSDFVIVDFIANKKSPKVRDFFINLYPNHEKEIVETLVLVNNFNSSKEWIDYLTTEIKFVYNEIITDIDKERFLKQYGVIIPIESLAYVHEKIQGVADVEFQVSQKEFEEKKKNQGVFDPIIGILCSLSNSERFKDAGVLLMDYFRKRQDKIYEVFLAIKANFDIEQEWDLYLEKRFSILEIFFDEKNVNELTALLIINIVEEFLNFTGESITFDGKNGVINRYKLVDGEYLIRLHKKIFAILYKVYKYEYTEVNNYIDNLLLNFPVYEVQNGFLRIISSDLIYIKNLFFKNLNELSLKQEAIVARLNTQAKQYGITSNPFFEYRPSGKQDIYRAFSSNMFDYETKNFDYERSQTLRKKNLKEVFGNYSNDLLELFNTLGLFQSDEILNRYELEESILLLYLGIDIEDKKKMLKALLNSEFTLSYYHFDSFMRELPFLESQGILNSIEKKVDERWYLSNFLACKKVNNDEIEELLLFLKNIEDQKIVNSFNILSFTNYIETDTIILKFLFFQYDEGNVLGSFFIPNHISEDKAERIINIVGYKDLKRIYLNALEDENIDGSGQFLRCLLSERDADFISSYLIKLNSLRLNFNSVKRDVQIKNIWISPIAEEGIKKYLDFLIKENRVIYAGIDLYLENLFKANIERSFEFIKEEIINTEDEKKLVDLYNISLEIFNDEISLSLFDLLRDKKIGSDFFEKLYLTMRSKNWSGSLVPLLDKDIIFLKKLLDIFEGIENISHSLIITRKIDLLKKEKEKELLSDYLE